MRDNRPLVRYHALAMTDPARPDNSLPEPDKTKAGEGGSPVPPEGPVAPETKKLTPEEQMALYEEHLKETDWGHQPC